VRAPLEHLRRVEVAAVGGVDRHAPTLFGGPPGLVRTGHGVRPAARTVLGWLAVLLQLLVAFPYVVSGLVVPGRYLAGLGLLWIASSAVTLRLVGRRSPFAPLVPVAALATWYVVVALGVRYLYWSG
jgi:hypothetical protein